MQFLADENFPFDAVQALRQANHDVVWIRVKIRDCHFEPFDRRGEVAGVESIAFLWVSGGEIIKNRS